MHLKLLGLLALAVVISFSGVTHADDTFVGVGIVVESEDKSIQIIEVIEKGPADRAGVTAGEWITAVDGKSTQDKKLKEVVSWIRGEVGTQVTLSLQSSKRESSREVQLTREVVVVKCFMEGNVNLTFYSSGNNFGSLSGRINGEQVNWQVSNGYVSGKYNGQYLSHLQFQEDMNHNIQVSGWIMGTFINWHGFNNQIFANQSCIR